MADEGQSNGDGILADQGSQDFSALATGQDGVQQTTQTGGAGEGQGTQQQTTQQTGQQTQQTQTGGTGQQQTQTATQTQQQPDLQSIIKSTVDATAAAMQRTAQPATQQRQTQEISPQEFDRRYGIIRPNEQMLTAILGQDPKIAVQTLDQLFQSNLTAALRMSNDLVEAKLKELDSKYQPHISS